MALVPENASEPPHCCATLSAEAGQRRRTHEVTSGSSARARASAASSSAPRVSVRVRVRARVRVRVRD